MINDFIFHLFSYLCSTIKKHPIIMKNFIKGFRFTPSNYPAEVEAKIQKYRKQGYKLPCLMRSTFSTTTMASSTSKPIASTIANNVRVLIE